MSKSLRTRYAELHRQFGTAGLILSVIAIVLALGGGAYAANNTGVASKAGKPGPRGKTGATGPAGPAGPRVRPVRPVPPAPTEPTALAGPAAKASTLPPKANASNSPTKPAPAKPATAPPASLKPSRPVNPRRVRSTYSRFLTGRRARNTQRTSTSLLLSLSSLM